MRNPDLRKRLEIPAALMERMFPNSNGTVEEFLCHRLPYGQTKTSKVKSNLNLYLSDTPPTCTVFDPTAFSTPPLPIINALIKTLENSDDAMAYQSIAFAHLPTHKETYPLYFLTYWVELPALRQKQEAWKTAVDSLRKRAARDGSGQAEKLAGRMLRLRWDSTLRGFDECGPLDGLLKLCGKAWLETSQVNQMLEIIEKETHPSIHGIRILPSDHAQRILSLYDDEEDDYDTNPCYADLHEQGIDLTVGDIQEAATVANINRNHWVALVVDFPEKRVMYGDSLQGDVHPKLQAAYNSWISRYDATEFQWASLPITPQPDGCNCAIFAVNAVAHRIDGRKYPLLGTDTSGGPGERLRMLEKILDVHESTVHHSVHEPEWNADTHIPNRASNTRLRDDDDATGVAEKSRPARHIEERYKKKNRTHNSGRKKTRETRDRVYTNWMSPFLWSQILVAGRVTKDIQGLSATKTVAHLKKTDPSTFAGLYPSTVQGWFSRLEDGTRVWSEAVLERAQNQAHTPGHDRGGRKGALSAYPELVEAITERLTRLREAAAPLNLVAVRAILVAMINKEAPEIFDRRYADGSYFKVSDSFCRTFLRKALGWSERKATKAAQKLPRNWEDQCERAILRRAQMIKAEDIPAELIVNSDQTGVVYSPGGKLTWTPRGSRQVAVIGAEERRAFTALLAISGSGEVLPIQAIFTGLTSESCPKSNAENYKDCIDAKFRFRPSGTKTYWSNHETMHDFVDNILAPFFDEQKKRLGLEPDQKSLWILDVWSVQRSKQFRNWMRTHHPNILFDFIPGGCTGVGQPLGVGINRPFKQAIKNCYHAFVVDNLMRQLDDGTELHFDTHIGPLRQACVHWLWDAYTIINNPALVKKAFAMCKVREWDLSYECLTSPRIRSRLRKEQSEKTAFWDELQSNTLPADDENDVAEDQMPRVDMDEEDGPDDSDISPGAVIADVTGIKKRRRVAKKPDGVGLCSAAAAEDPEAEVGPDDLEGEKEDSKLGRSKRLRKVTRRYLDWLNDDDSEEEDEVEE
ncbi:hypothetical protein GGX14DRAFT_672342 [Mycena pura]|uniref:Ubiquitin-like protease family profile domain-containing protein n=1 Tax=Mycena pura TaxID=153505 RepID=A0AAD6UXC8_9AGAR|nr:hypothetical protein GGX14DRAFT_672342 [Mycena pura]